MSKSIEVTGDACIDWMYPNLYKENGPLTRLTINMMHVRASNSFTIEFDGERDGFVLRTDRVVEGDGVIEMVEEGVEVGFIPAWLWAEKRAPGREG